MAEIISLSEFRLKLLTQQMVEKQSEYQEIVENNQKDIQRVEVVTRDIQNIGMAIKHFEKIRGKEEA